MAHQWWGIGVERRTIVTHGCGRLRRFSGLWYMQIILNDNEKYLRNSGIRRSDPARPRNRRRSVWGIARRKAGGCLPRRHYQKGAWCSNAPQPVLDTRTMSEERFSNMMTLLRDLPRQTRLDGRLPTHRRACSRADMDWFFKRMGVRHAIPTYTSLDHGARQRRDCRPPARAAE